MWPNNKAELHYNDIFLALSYLGTLVWWLLYIFGSIAGMFHIQEFALG